MIDCKHKNTQIWEPHLAGARKRRDCNMVYNPNFTPNWFYEKPPKIYSKDDIAPLLEALETIKARAVPAGRGGAVVFTLRTAKEICIQALEKFKEDQ